MRPLTRQNRTEEVPWIHGQGDSSHDKVETKLESNQRQSEVKLESKLESNQRQSEVKIETRKTLKAKTRDKVESKVETRKVKTEDKVESKWSQKTSFATLSDAEKTIIQFMHEDCLANGSLETKEIRVGFISTLLNIPIPTVKKTIQRLEDLNHVYRIRFKNGRGGWTIYGISKNMYDQIRSYDGRSKVETKWSQSRDKVESKVESEVESSSPSSSSINITTTNYKADALANTQIELTESLMAIGFNNGHVDQLKRDSALNSEEIQNSLDAFAFDLGFEDVRRKVRSPIGLIMKLLKNGQAYVSEKGYESEEDRLYRESIERAEKKKEERKNLEAKLIGIKFDEWLENISDDEKKNLAKPIGEFMGLIHQQELKEYFRREIFR